MQLHVVILTLKFVYSGDGNQMLSKGIFALLAFLTVQHYNNHNYNNQLQQSSTIVGACVGLLHFTHVSFGGFLPSPLLGRASFHLSLIDIELNDY